MRRDPAGGCRRRPSLSAPATPRLVLAHDAVEAAVAAELLGVGPEVAVAARLQSQRAAVLCQICHNQVLHERRVARSATGPRITWQPHGRSRTLAVGPCWRLEGTGAVPLHGRLL